MPMKLYSIAFEPAWPVPGGLIIQAENEDQALEIAGKLVQIKGITEITLDGPGVIFYESGEY